MPTFPSTSYTGSNYSSPSLNYGPPPTMPQTTPGAAPETGSTAALINSLNRNAQGAANAARIPGAANLEAQSSANIGSELAGQLPADVLALLGQQSGERSAAMGTAGPNAKAAYLRALGLTSLQQEQTGQQNLSAAYARNPGAPIYDPSQLVLGPGQAGQLGLSYDQAMQQYYQNRLPQGGGGGGGGGGSRGGGVQMEAPSSSPYTPSPIVDSGYSPSLAWRQNPTTAWQASINYNPDAGSLPGGGFTTINGQVLDASGNLVSPFAQAQGVDTPVMDPTAPMDAYA